MTALGTGPLSDSLCLLPHPHCPEVESRQRRTAGRRVLSARRPVGAPHYPPPVLVQGGPSGLPRQSWMKPKGHSSSKTQGRW